MLLGQCVFIIFFKTVLQRFSYLLFNRFSILIPAVAQHSQLRYYVMLPHMHNIAPGHAFDRPFIGYDSLLVDHASQI